MQLAGPSGWYHFAGGSLNLLRRNLVRERDVNNGFQLLSIYYVLNPSHRLSQ